MFFLSHQYGQKINPNPSTVLGAAVQQHQNLHRAFVRLGTPVSSASPRPLSRWEGLIFHPSLPKVIQFSNNPRLLHTNKPHHAKRHLAATARALQARRPPMCASAIQGTPARGKNT